jgi:CRP/FNR family transcriptional regulator, cyclic AMP receptor protein
MPKPGLRVGRIRRVRKLGLESLPLFAGIANKQLERLSSVSTSLSVPAGHVLARVGEPSEQCLIVVSGSARVERSGTSVGTLGRGSMVGEAGLLHGQPQLESVVAETAMDLLVMSKLEFKSAYFQVPVVAHRLLVQLASKLYRAEQQATRQVCEVPASELYPSDRRDASTRKVVAAT